MTRQVHCRTYAWRNSVTVPGQPAGGLYAYDWVRNRLHPPADPNPMVYNKADQLIRWPGMHIYAYDGAGNLTQVKNDSETQVVKSYAYDAYGSLLSHDRFDGSVNQPYQYVGQLGYYTHWVEPDFGLLQLGVRFYDPEVGRFGQRDPMRDFVSSLYVYSGGNPITFVDPLGEFHIRLECEMEAARIAMNWAGKYKEMWKDPDDNGPSNTMQHCIWTCLTMTRCGKIPSYFNNGHEYFTPGGTFIPILAHPDESRMDLYNNGQGRKCAGQAQKVREPVCGIWPLTRVRYLDDEGDCVSCCESKARNGDPHWINHHVIPKPDPGLPSIRPR